MVMVGDRVSTDGGFAETIGCRFALVLTGVSDASQVPFADLSGRDLLEVANELLREERETSR
jgi:ribonucleotide monophosphatase NagD (HAD superfamily)